MGTPKTEAGRAMQERKQRPLLKQIGRNWGGDTLYCSSASIMTYDLRSCRHPEDLRQLAKTSTPGISNSENDTFNVILSP